MTHNYWDDRNEEQRRRDFEGDVFYEAWRRGLNPDRATDCAMDCYHDGRTPDQCINGYEVAGGVRSMCSDAWNSCSTCPRSSGICSTSSWSKE